MQPDARVRGLPARVAINERLDDAGAELVAEVEREMRKAELVGQPAREADGGRRTATPLAVVLGVRPQLERDGDRVAATAAQQRGDRAVDSAAHRHERARSADRPREGRSLADGGAERPVQRVRGQVGGVELRGAEAAELGRDRARPDSRRLEHIDVPGQLDDGAPRRRGGAAPLGVESDVAHAVAGDGQEDLDPVTARGSARGAAERVGRPMPLALRGGQMMFKAGDFHRPPA